MTALIDGDIIAYTTAWTAESKDQSLPYTLKAVDNYIKRIIKESLSATYIIYLEGDGNFRKQVAKFKPYKGTRKSEKPRYFQAIKDYLCIHWGAYLVCGAETDDALAISQTLLGEKSVVCSIDKDLLQVPGWHMNIRDYKLHKVSKEVAKRLFWTQMLTGDSVDNIAGLPGCGKVGAIKILNNKKRMKKAVKAAYMIKLGDLELYRETFRLIYLIRKNKSFKLPTPCSYLKKRIANDEDV